MCNSCITLPSTFTYNSMFPHSLRLKCEPVIFVFSEAIDLVLTVFCPLEQGAFCLLDISEIRLICFDNSQS